MLFPLLIGVAAGVAFQRFILAEEEKKDFNIFDEYNYIKAKGMGMGVQELIYQLSHTDKVVEMMAYTAALKTNFRKLDRDCAPEWQLKQYFKMAFAFATRTELAHREDGKIVCDY